jgi:hypothetical protein
VPKEEQDALKRASQLLPAWFIPRMMEDVWSFGLLMSEGTLISIDTILDVHQAADGSIWLDVRLSEGIPFTIEKYPKLLKSPTSRTDASINARYTMAAFETADT